MFFSVRRSFFLTQENGKMYSKKITKEIQMWEIETNLKWSNLTKEEKMKHGIIQARKERLERSKRCCRNMPPMFVGSVVATSIVISWLFFFTFSLALAWNRWGMYKSKIKKRKEEKRGSRIWKALVDLDFRF